MQAERKQWPLEIQVGEQVSYGSSLFRVVKEQEAGWRGVLHIRPALSKNSGEEFFHGDLFVPRSSVERLRKI